MKNFTMFFWLVSFSASALASSTESVVWCVKSFNSYSAAIACQGVKNFAEMKAVVSCVKSFDSFSAAIACQGVKNFAEVEAVVSCVKSFDSYSAAIACQGVKTLGIESLPEF